VVYLENLSVTWIRSVNGTLHDSNM